MKSMNNTNNMKNKKEIIEKIYILNAKAKNAKQRKGLWRTKYEIYERAWNLYCTKNNSPKTNGGWIEKKSCSTKSQWQYKNEEKDIKIEIQNDGIKGVEKTHGAIIITEIDAKKAQVFEGKIVQKFIIQNGERIDREYRVWIKVNKKMMEILCYKTENEINYNNQGDQEININEGKIKLRELYLLGKENNTELFEITGIKGE